MIFTIGVEAANDGAAPMRANVYKREERERERGEIERKRRGRETLE